MKRRSTAASESAPRAPRWWRLWRGWFAAIGRRDHRAWLRGLAEGLVLVVVGAVSLTPLIPPSEQAIYRAWLEVGRVEFGMETAEAYGRTYAATESEMAARRFVERRMLESEFALRQALVAAIVSYADLSNLGLDQPALVADDARLMMTASLDEADVRLDYLVGFDARSARGIAARMSATDVHEGVITSLEAEIAVRIDRAYGIIRHTGISRLRLMQDFSPDADELPATIRALLANRRLSREFRERAAQVIARFQEAEYVAQLMQAAPLASPTLESAEFGPGYGISGVDDFHLGLDLTPEALVSASADGVVVFVGVREGGYGRVIEIDHGRTFKTRYAGLATIDVVRGDRVTRGQRLGSLVADQNVRAPHPHYEVWYQGRAHDPYYFIVAGRLLVEAS